MKIETAVATSWVTSLKGTPGQETSGRPPGTFPRLETPCEARSAPQLTAIAPTTAISAPGIFLFTNRSPTIVARTQTEVRTVAPFASGMFPSAVTNFRIVPPSPSETPSIPATWPIATWIPTPVRKPTRTERERKSATNPSRSRRARSRIPAVISASIPASAMYSGEPIAAMPITAGGHDHGRRRVGSDDEVPRRAEHCEERDRDEDRVQPGDDGHAGDLRVAHHLGDADRRERQACDHLRADALLPEREYALKNREAEDAPGSR